MRNLLIIALTLVFTSFTNGLEAQQRRAKAHKGKKGNITVVHKGKHVHAHKTHTKRVKRTRVVHHHYRHLPKRGAVVTSIHTKALTVRYKGIGFRFHSGVWYKPRGTSWVVVRPSYGIRIRVLPVGYRRIAVGPSVYYYYYGTYCVKKDNEYEVIKAPKGAEIDSLPDGYKTVTVQGNKYYEMDDIYYMPGLNQEGEEVLVVVEDPTIKM